MNEVTHECLCQNLSHSTYGWKDEPSHQQVPWSKFKSSYLRVEGQTKPPASALVQNLSPSTYGWKDEPSHSQVSWSKFKSFYLRVKKRTKSLTGALVEIYKVLLPTSGRTNQATNNCLGTKFKSFYL